MGQVLKNGPSKIAQGTVLKDSLGPFLNVTEYHLSWFHPTFTVCVSA